MRVPFPLGRRRIARALGRLLIVTSLSLATAPAALADSTSDSNEFVDRVIHLTNLERETAGLPPLAPQPSLDGAAQSYAEVLASSGCFGHTCGPVPHFADRAAQAGYGNWSALGENVAGGQRTPEAVVAGWMASPGHQANILSPDFAEIGVGLASGGRLGTYWVQVFGSQGW